MRSHFHAMSFSCLAMAFMFFSTPPLDAVEIVAHRGASHDAPENTVASFQLGWKQHADAGELDIRLTKDLQIVVIHDADAKRTTATSSPVANRTLAELRALDAGSWKGPQWKGQRLPTRSEALATVPDGKRMFIEIKCGREVLPILEGVLHDSGKKPRQLVLIGFKYDTMAQAKQRFPDLTVYWIVGYGKDKKTGMGPPRLAEMIDRAKAARFDGLDLSFKFPIDAAFVTQVKAAGLQLHAWTVDDAAVAAKLVAAGVDGITTNRPGWLREQLQ
jgi:glycerophosphoryl diester phosphodiesterase